MGGWASSTVWPSDWQSAAASRTAAAQSGCTVFPKSDFAVKARRSLPGSRATSSRNGRSGGSAL